MKLLNISFAKFNCLTYYYYWFQYYSLYHFQEAIFFRLTFHLFILSVTFYLFANF